MADSRIWSAQQEAIFDFFQHGQGNLVVRARAGTGKTTTILQAIDFAPEQKILLAAFNKRIAEELKTKLKNPRAKAQTLHGVGFGLVLRNWATRGTKLDVEDTRCFRIAMETLGWGNIPMADGFQKKVGHAVKKIASMAKNIAPFATVSQLQDIASEYDLLPDDYEELDERGYGIGVLAEQALMTMAACARPNTHGPATIDFDDMIFVPLRNNWVKGVNGMVVIDEAQDMNAAQLLLAQRSCAQGGRIVVVGDDKQAIYGFRGADSASLDRLKDELQAQELGLTITYRCPRKVVALAQELVPDFHAAPEAPEGVISVLFENGLPEAVQPNDFVLSRKNAPLVRLCLAVLKTSKRARIEGRDIGRGIIQLVEKQKARDLVTLEKKLAAWEQKQCQRLVARLGEDRAAGKCAEIRDTRSTIVSLADGLKTVAELVARVNVLFSDDGVDQVVFSSVHKAKGLEAERVFLIEDSFIMKHPRVDRSEEANVRYVALTRSKAELVHVHPNIAQVQQPEAA